MSLVTFNPIYFLPTEIIMPQSFQDDHFDALETVVEKSSVFLNLLAIQRRLNCDELYILENVVKVLAVVHPETYAPAPQRVALSV